MVGAPSHIIHRTEADMDFLSGLRPDQRELLKLIMRDPPRPCDAVVWLQGDRYDRGAKVLDLYKRAFASRIVITGNNRFVGPDTKPDQDNITLDEMHTWLVEQNVLSHHIFIDEAAHNTHEQAENTIRLALSQGWESLGLVASFYHQPRAFLTFYESGRRHGWLGPIINYPTPLSSVPPSGRSRPMALYLTEEFEKIDRYTEHVAPIDEGIAWLKTLKAYAGD